MVPNLQWKLIGFLIEVKTVFMDIEVIIILREMNMCRIKSRKS